MSDESETAADQFEKASPAASVGAASGKVRRRRWPRRLIIGGSVVGVLVLILAISVYVYAKIQFDKIPKVKIASLTSVVPGAPFNVLVVGSDSRSFVTTPGQQQQFGNPSTQTGQRSDVTIIARVDPAHHQVLLMSIPRDTYVHIPGKVPYISGMNRINAAFNSGPDLLVQTIQDDFGIPINHFVEVNFAGFSNIVNALGGIYLDFKYPVKDKNSNLNITQTGCQLLNGTQALALVRSRDESYSPSPGVWDYDGMGDWSRIRRQDAFFHAVIARVDGEFTNPLALNNFISATVGDMVIDDTFSETGLIDLGRDFQGLTQQQLQTEVLPTTPEVVNGSDVLYEAQPYGAAMVKKFLAFGSAPPPAPGKKGTPALTPLQIHVEVLNGSGIKQIAGEVSQELHGLGYKIAGTGNAKNFGYTQNEIVYGPKGSAAAHRLGQNIVDGATLTQEPTITGSTVTLIIGSYWDGVESNSAATTPTTFPTGNTAPIGDVVFDNPQTLPEPWDPTVCSG